MEITGKIVNVMQVVTGNGKKGMWSKQDFVIELPGNYPKKVCMSLWGEEMINKYDLTIGLTVTAHVNLESREYNGRWYTEVRAWKLTWEAQTDRKWQPAGHSAQDPEPDYKAPSEHSLPSVDDLPF